MTDPADDISARAEETACRIATRFAVWLGLAGNNATIQAKLIEFGKSEILAALQEQDEATVARVMLVPLKAAEG